MTKTNNKRAMMNHVDYINVDKNKLLETLTENKKKHTVELKEAILSRREEAKRKLQAIIDNIDDDPNYNPPVNIQLPMPSDNTSDYEKEILKYEYSVDEVVRLTDMQVDRFLGDNWGWKQEFLATSSLYSQHKL